MRIWNSRLLDSKIKTDTVSKAEMILGYLIGPSLMYLMTTALSGTYLMQFYTDVIGISGTMIVLMPVISKIGVVIMNIIFSSLINKTNTRQGKARPWLLISGIILPLAGILLYAVPQASYRIQVIWILLSYNFFFVVAYNIYILSHSMMLPRSTRDSASRDKLTLFKTVSESMIPGTLSAVIMPFIIRAIGVGNGAQEKWFRFMLILSIIAVPAALIEYYFTIERTEDTNRENITLLQQLKESFRYRKWVMIIILISLKALESAFLSNTMIYYCNWVIGNSIDSGAHYQALLNVIGQGPLGIGAFLMASLLKKYDKFTIIRYSCMIGVVGALMMLFASGNVIVVLAGMMLRSIGNIPMMMSVAMLSDVMDEIEAESGYRFDSLGASLSSIIHNISVGLSQTLILLAINRLGYIIPSDSAAVIQQPLQLRMFFTAGMALIPLIQFVLSFLIVSKMSRESK